MTTRRIARTLLVGLDYAAGRALETSLGDARYLPYMPDAFVRVADGPAAGR